MLSAGKGIRSPIGNLSTYPLGRTKCSCARSDPVAVLGGMTTLTESTAAAFAENGFAVVPGVLSEAEQVGWRAVVHAAVAEQPPSVGHSGPHFLWPQFPPTGHPLLELYAASRVPDLVRELLRPGLTLQPPGFGQIALTLPPHRHRPGGPHIDGLTPTEPDGRPGTFTLLAGVLLTDQREQDRGNLWVWPGTHLRTGSWLREHGPDALRSAVPYPPVDLGRPVQVTAPAGSLLIAHYLLAHNIGGHFGTAQDEPRETVYFRLHAADHRDRWRQVVTDPLSEFAVTTAQGPPGSRDAIRRTGTAAGAGDALSGGSYDAPSAVC